MVRAMTLPDPAADNDDDTPVEAAARRLDAAVRRMRLVAADRLDAVEATAIGARERIGLLAEKATPLGQSIPEGLDLFLFEASFGETPRFFVDVTTHVAMARDGRTYRLVRDTRAGRAVILETTDVDRLVERLTDLVAERIVERERAFEPPRTETAPVAAVPAPTARVEVGSGTGGRLTLVFLTGLVAGLTLAFAAWSAGVLR